MNVKMLVFLLVLAGSSFKAIASSMSADTNEIAEAYKLAELPRFEETDEYFTNQKAADIYHENKVLVNAIKRQLTLDHVERTIRDGANVNHKVDGKTPVLVLAAKSGALEVVDLLLRNGADINATDEKGKNGLMWVINEESSRITTDSEFAEKFAKIGELLIEKGINLNVGDAEGRTALIAAAWGLRKKFVQLLLDKSADPTKQSLYGRTALDDARDAAKYLPKSSKDQKTVKAAEEAAELIKLIEQAVQQRVVKA